MKFSRFAKQFSPDAGIVQLMDDLGSAMSNNDMLMLGGGNPSHLPEVQQYFHKRLQDIYERPAEFAHIIGDYDSPQGNIHFINALVKFLNSRYDWGLTKENIALTGGSQTAFFMLFNMFAGEYPDNEHRKILLPMAPEYIGYSDLGLHDDIFLSKKPVIEKLDDHLFKYHVDFGQIKINSEIGAICVSRPSNPTGNVLTEDEITRLSALSEEYKIPLIIDGAYGLPFPNIIFENIEPVWNKKTILCLSLSKLGLPGTRTGIVIADREIIQYITSMNAIINLAQGSFGPALAYDIIDSGDVVHVCNDVIKPFYQARANQAMLWINEYFEGIDYYIHKPEGAIFLWLWFPGLPISSQELYERLKARGVLILSGHHFFPGINEDWQHKHECIRLTYSQSSETVEAGLKIIASEIQELVY